MNFNQDFTLNTLSLTDDLYRRANVSVTLIRSDLIHQQVSGNKWFKLKYSLLAALEENVSQVITFGGAYSNHIHALAYAANTMGLKSIGFIRGQWTEDNLTLRDAQSWGMQLESLSRDQYREKSTATFIQALANRYPNSMIIPEGGSNSLALQGVAELMTQIEQQLPNLDCLVVPCGTGGTLAGLVSAAHRTKNVLGIPVLKGAGFLKDDINGLLTGAGVSAICPWSLDLDGHYGGYAKVKNNDKEKMAVLEAQHQVQLEPVYSAKMFRRFNELVAQGHFLPESHIALLHCGGLQGRRGFSL